jgi:hypothetical protein
MTIRQFTRSFVRKHHPTLMNANYRRTEQWPGWEYYVYCRGGRRYVYSLDLLSELYERDKHQ